MNRTKEAFLQLIDILNKDNLDLKTKLDFHLRSVKARRISIEMSVNTPTSIPDFTIGDNFNVEGWFFELTSLDRTKQTITLQLKRGQQ